MDKSLGTNLHLWRFFKRAKQTVTREFIYTWSAPPSQLPTYNVGHSAFLKLRFENTEN